MVQKTTIVQQLLETAEKFCFNLFQCLRKKTTLQDEVFHNPLKTTQPFRDAVSLMIKSLFQENQLSYAGDKRNKTKNLAADFSDSTFQKENPTSSEKSFS